MISNFRLLRFIKKYGISLKVLIIGAGLMGLVNLVLVCYLFNWSV